MEDKFLVEIIVLPPDKTHCCCLLGSKKQCRFLAVHNKNHCCMKKLPEVDIFLKELETHGNNSTYDLCEGFP